MDTKVLGLTHPAWECTLVLPWRSTIQQNLLAFLKHIPFDSEILLPEIYPAEKLPQMCKNVNMGAWFATEIL